MLGNKMIRTYILILITFSLNIFASDIINIKFTNSANQSYQTTHLLKDLKTNDHIELKKAYVLLIETPSLHNTYYKIQSDELEKFSNISEVYHVLFVVASAKEEYLDSYHTTIETAKKLLKKDAYFKVRLLNSTGVLLNESRQPVKVIELKKWLKL
jgi:hypothetical protein